MDLPRTKLVCTIGPASVERARELVDVGMSVARINFSHGTPEEQKAAVHAVRAAAHHARRSVAVMVDLPGPKIRLGDLPDGQLELEIGQSFELRANRPTLGHEVQVGDRILLADGAVELVVVEAPGSDVGGHQLDNRPTATAPTESEDQPPEPAPTESAEPEPAPAEPEPAPTESAEPEPAPAEPEPAPPEPPADGTVHTEVVRGGLIRSRAGVNIPTERLGAEALTDEDRSAIPRALELRADLVAQSFVRNADDVRALRQLLPSPGPLVVAKIETRVAVEDYEAILEVVDGVMVARGDLGVDLPYEELPLIQKDLLRRGLARGRFTIVATQMLESMTAARRPTRAEASDVANAVLDGTDAVMLSAETAIGAYPVEAARTMIDICAATEGGALTTSVRPALDQPTADGPEAICRAAVALAGSHLPTTAIWCFTRSGRTAELLSALRPRVPVVAFTINAVAARRAAVRSSVVPIVLSASRGGQPLVDQMVTAARAHGVMGVSGGATILLVTTSSRLGGINRLELHAIE